MGKETFEEEQEPVEDTPVVIQERLKNEFKNAFAQNDGKYI